MAKKKAIELKDILTKLGNVFPRDLIIIDGVDIVEGNKTFDENDGHFTATLLPEASQVINETFPKEKYIYIKDVKKAKTDLDEFVSFNLKDIDIESAELERKRFLTKCRDLKTWNTFDISEEKIDDIFLGKDVTITTPENKDLKINLSKSLLPLVTKSNFHEMQYSLRKVDGVDEDIVDVVFSVDHDLFDFYMVYSYLVC